jgi:class 3 adenylate cyclase
MEAVHRYEGTVNQVMGNGIMALFGAPLAHEDHAVSLAQLGRFPEASEYDAEALAGPRRVRPSSPTAISASASSTGAGARASKRLST